MAPTSRSYTLFIHHEYVQVNFIRFPPPSTSDLEQSGFNSHFQVGILSFGALAGCEKGYPSGQVFVAHGERNGCDTMTHIAGYSVNIQ